MGNKRSLYQFLLFMSLLLLGFFSVNIQSPSTYAAVNVPAPPASGPPVAGNFIINQYNPTQEAKYRNMQVISDGTNTKYESMWYKNPVNITRPFETKFYIYMAGDADGLTFTLQGQGKNAIGFNGESLGAYMNFRASSPDNNYVHNALSLEFDPYYNGDYSDSQLGFTGAHIAYTLPGEYKINSSQNNHMAAVHYSPLSTPDLNNGKWHAIVVSWTPNNVDNTGTMTTSYDGKSVGSKKVPLSQFGKGDVYWGFTGSTGAESMVGAVAYTEVIQQPRFSKLVRNVSNGETEFKDTTTAKIGDKLEYEFITENDRENGIGNTWETVNITDTLPKGITTLDDKQKVTIPVGDVGVAETKIKYISAKVTVDDTVSLENVADANGSNYYTAPKNLTSNTAVVNVKKVEHPLPAKLKIDDTIFNRTFSNSHDTTNTTISDAIAGDTVEYITKINNTEVKSRLINGKYVFNVPGKTKLSSISLDGNTLTLGTDYTVQDDGSYQAITIKNLNIDGGSSITLDAKATLSAADNADSFTMTPEIKGNNIDGSTYQLTGTALKINYSKNLLALSPVNIDFGGHPFVNHDQIINREATTNAPNSVLNITDARRNHVPVKLFVNQNGPFKLLSDLNVVLPSQLRLYQNNSFVTLDDNPVEIAETKSGDQVKSVIWNKDEGLKLYSNGTNFMPGDYQTTLTWTATVDGY